jgi:hypothetical protein
MQYQADAFKAIVAFDDGANAAGTRYTSGPGSRLRLHGSR